ncbi:hypothetical protein CkaCkLH20_03434 [Colletotrichum karsti]|uniref:Uncharacterized protein n=1 Tax=Colletotrichum karsti TaxID=1095194 RepID=A0A9P6IET3_9PEZI|nr:uncharacterized protein CkaCkLH20_03434 [Colletotrichum karsti]KAF9879201.1 hypothetical protein CkaCkLH20_03434 [Colletotrichum karsti]
MSFPDAATILKDHKKLYSPGKILHITPHGAPKPWGWKFYPMPPDLGDEEIGQAAADKTLTRAGLVFREKNQPHNLDRSIQKDDSLKMKVEILAVHGTGPGTYSPGIQKLKCKVLEVPLTPPLYENQRTPAVGDVIFIKAFDPMFFPRVVDPMEAHFKVTARADMALSDEVGAYAFLYKHGMTGAPHIAPQWFGCWTAEVQSTDPNFQTRYVGVIALEFIDGICLQKLFVKDDVGNQIYVGDMPDLDDDTKTLLQVDVATRLGTMKDLLAGVVRQYKIGLSHYHIHPESVILTFRRGSQDLERPRVSLVGYTKSVVHPLRDPPRNVYANYTRPIHPFYRFNYSRLEAFFNCHWLPLGWKTNHPRISPLLNYWLLRTFGPLDSDEYSTLIRPSHGTVSAQPIEDSPLLHPSHEPFLAQNIESSVLQKMDEAIFFGNLTSEGETSVPTQSSTPRNTTADT